MQLHGDDPHGGRPPKVFRTYADQVRLLESRGMQVGDRDRAERLLRTTNYYRLSGYWYPYRQRSADGEGRSNTFVPGTSFDDVVAGTASSWLAGAVAGIAGAVWRVSAVENRVVGEVSRGETPMHSRKVLPSTFAVAGAVALALTGCSDSGESADSGASTSVEAGQSESSSAAADTESSAGESSEPAGDDASGEGATAADADLREVEFAVTAQDALDTSADEVGTEGIVHALEIDHSDSDDMWQWSVKTLVDGTDHKVTINADTGDVVAHEQESTDDQEKAIDLEDPMTQEEAQKLALKKIEGPIEGWKLEWDDGMYQYQFDIGDGQGDEQEVTVDAENGNVSVDD